MNSQTMNNIHELMVTKQLQRRPLESNHSNPHRLWLFNLKCSDSNCARKRVEYLQFSRHSQSLLLCVARDYFSCVCSQVGWSQSTSGSFLLPVCWGLKMAPNQPGRPSADLLNRRLATGLGSHTAMNTCHYWVRSSPARYLLRKRWKHW